MTSGRAVHHVRTMQRLRAGSGYSAATAVIAENVSSADGHYLQILCKLKSFQKQQKVRISEHEHKFDWMREHHHLQALVEAAEKDMTSTTLGWCSSSGANDDDECTTAELWSQLSELRSLVSMLSELKTYHSDRRETRPADSEENAQNTDSCNDAQVAISLLAQLLLDAKQKCERSRLTVDSTEDQVVRGAEEARAAVIRILKEDRRATQQQHAFASAYGLVQSLEDDMPRKDDPVELEMARGDILARFHDLEESHRLQRERLEETAPPACILTSWSALDQKRFSHIVKTSRPKRVTGRLRLEFSQVPYEDLVAFQKWYRDMCFFDMKRKALRKTVAQEQETLRAWAKEELARVKRAAVQEQERAEELRRWEEMRTMQHERLTQLRKEKEKEVNVRQEEEEQANRHAEAAERRDAEKRARERQERRVLVAEYLEQRAAELAVRQQQQAKEEERERGERRERMAVNAERVEHRNELLQQKRQQEEEARRQMELREEKTRRILMHIAAQVPYAERIANVKADPLKPTAFLKNNTFVPDDGSSAFKPLHGFTDQRTFQDIRFRIGLALRNAGLADCSYAGQVIAAMAPRAAAPYC